MLCVCAVPAQVFREGAREAEGATRRQGSSAAIGVVCVGRWRPRRRSPSASPNVAPPIAPNVLVATNQTTILWRRRALACGAGAGGCNHGVPSNKDAKRGNHKDPSQKDAYASVNRGECPAPTPHEPCRSSGKVSPPGARAASTSGGRGALAAAGTAGRSRQRRLERRRRPRPPRQQWRLKPWFPPHRSSTPPYRSSSPRSQR